VESPVNRILACDEMAPLLREAVLLEKLTRVLPLNMISDKHTTPPSLALLCMNITLVCLEMSLFDRYP